jgi:hypothetical protein
VYIRLPNGRLAKLRKALYGLRRSPGLWYQELSRFLATIGYYSIEADPCVFINTDGGITLAYVDDLVLITRTVDQMAALKALIFGKFKCHDLGPILHYLGIRVRRDRTRRAIELTSLPASRKTPLAEKIPTLDALLITLLVLRIYSVLNTILYVFLLQTLYCSKKNTTFLVVLLIVLSTMSNSASCLHPYCTASINIILDFRALRLQV